MKAFIDKIFKKRKQDVKQLEEPIRPEDKATEAMVEAIIEEVKKVEKEIPYKIEPKQEVVELKKPKHFPDCNCFKCERWKRQNAK